MYGRLHLATCTGGRQTAASGRSTLQNLYNSLLPQNTSQNTPSYTKSIRISKTSIKSPTTKVFKPEIQAFDEFPTNLKESFDARQHQVKVLGYTLHARNICREDPGSGFFSIAETKAVVVVAVVRIVVITVSHTAVSCIVVPATATQQSLWHLDL
jgi:hypothetical protein